MKTFLAKVSVVDIVGFWTSAACALHCLILPLLLTMGASSGLAFLDQPYVEGSIIALSVLFGLSSMLPSYFRHHRKFSALCFLFLGFALIGLSRIAAFEAWEIMLTSSGAALVASAHIINYRLRKGSGSSNSWHS